MITSFCKEIYDMLCKKYPNKNIFIISDHHFYHFNIIQYTRNQFNSIENMHSYIIKKHNEVVDKEDICLFLGDFCFKNTNITEILSKLNGHKYLLMGNHDQESLIKKYPSLGFEGLFTMPVKLQGSYLSHEPLIASENLNLQFQNIVKEFNKSLQSINYHGHIHTTENELGDRYKNVTCEALEYKPYFVGRTKQFISNEKELFINTDYFDNAVKYVYKKHNIDSFILLSDYIYSFILESCQSNANNFFVQGSFGLFKKYGFISKFSDLDITFLYNTRLSQGKNHETLRSFADYSFQQLQMLDRINLEWYKRFSSLRIYEFFYTSKNSYFAKGYFDSNLIRLDCYKDSDFFLSEGKSLLEKMIYLNQRLSTNFKFPSYQIQFLTPEGDIANLLLQFLFQKGNTDKRKMALKKLKYIYENVFKEKDIQDFSNILSRFFLRNIALFSTMNRYDEIEYIKEIKDSFVSDLSHLPNHLQQEVRKTIFDSASPFLEVYDKISSSENDVMSTCTELIKTLKNNRNNK